MLWLNGVIKLLVTKTWCDLQSINEIAALLNIKLGDFIIFHRFPECFSYNIILPIFPAESLNLTSNFCALLAGPTINSTAR